MYNVLDIRISIVDRLSWMSIFPISPSTGASESLNRKPYLKWIVIRLTLQLVAVYTFYASTAENLPIWVSEALTEPPHPL